MEYSGPLPPPAHFEKYDGILPGAAERILAMAENEQKHRHQLNHKVEQSARRGLRYGFWFGLWSLVLAGFFVWQGAALQGMVVAGAYLVTIVGAFIYGSQKRRPDGS